jgi:deoxyribonuclease-4
VSVAGGPQNAVSRAEDIGANAMGIFTRNQRQWEAPPLSDEAVRLFRAALSRSRVAPAHVVPHSSYLINVAGPDGATRRRSISALTEEAQRAAALGLTMLNFHPGSHLGKMSEKEGIARIADGMNQVLRSTRGVTLVLETTAGTGNNLGGRFEELALIIELVDDVSRVGVCIDTCHIYAAGYDIRSRTGWNSVIREFDSIVGLSFLRAMHVNDSKTSLGSHRDRHESLGRGRLGWNTFRTILRDSRIRHVPMILETTRPHRWAAEIRRLRGFARPNPDRYRAWPETRRIVRSQDGSGLGRSR